MSVRQYAEAEGRGYLTPEDGGGGLEAGGGGPPALPFPGGGGGPGAVKAEERLAADLAARLRAGGWEVYEEVATLRGRADIVGGKGPLVHLLECKVAVG